MLPFTSNSFCPKCGNLRPNKRWSDISQCLLMTCYGCGFTWQMKAKS